MKTHSTWRGRVSHVYDGDTIQVGGERVRLLGVDTPELYPKSSPGREECMAQAAKDYVEYRLQGQEVVLQSDPQGPLRDRFGRLLAWVFVQGRWLNRDLVLLGFGFVFRKGPQQELKMLLEAERWAAEHRRGIWNRCPVDCSGAYCRIGDGKDF